MTIDKWVRRIHTTHLMITRRNLVLLDCNPAAGLEFHSGYLWILSIPHQINAPIQQTQLQEATDSTAG